MSLELNNVSTKFQLNWPANNRIIAKFGTQVKFRWSRDRNDRSAENVFSAPWFFSEMELEPAAG